MGLWEKIKNIMVIPEDDYEEDYEEIEETSAKKETEAPKKAETPRIIKGKNDKGTSSQMQVVLVKPDRFEDVNNIADHLNARKTVVLNLEAADRDVSRRIIDFLSGVAYANHGNIRKVANSTFIIVAHDVDVMGELINGDFEDGKLYF
jgi:cell division inhibitor SepF